MFTKKFTTISIATVATFGALALNIESASARPGHGLRGDFHGGGIHRGFVRHGGFRHHGGWRHRHHRYGWGVYAAAPLLIGAAAYVPECYYVRRVGVLYKVCE
jgi:hypothetical protein